MIKILYQDEKLVVCIKPPGILSTDQPGGLPELLRNQLQTDNIRTVHRLDQVVGGVMVLARTSRAATDLSAEIADGTFRKSYLAVVHGTPESSGTFTDLLARDTEKRRTYVASAPCKNVREAILNYKTIATAEGLSLVSVSLVTGRTHQIRVQFASRGLPLMGDKKYGTDDGCDTIALWSRAVAFTHPKTGQSMEFQALPENTYPWRIFRG